MLKQVVEKVQGTLFLPPDDYSPPKETVKQNDPTKLFRALYQ